MYSIHSKKHVLVISYIQKKKESLKGMQRSLLTILVGLGTFVEEVDTVVGELLDLLSEVLVLILSSSLSL